MPTLGVGSRTQIAFVKEAAVGTTPANPKFTRFRNTGSSLGLDPKTVRSKEITPDGNVPDTTIVGQDVGGDVGIEWIGIAYRDVVESNLRTALQRSPERNGNSGTGSVTSVSGTAYTVDGTGGAFAANMLVRATGFSVSGNNQIGKLTGGSATTATIAASIEASPPATARLKQIGFEAASAGDVQAGASGLTSTTTNFTTLNLRPGQWVKIGGNALANQFGDVSAKTGAYLNNGYARISNSSAVTATACPLDIRPAGWTTDTATGKTIRVYYTDFAVNGTTVATLTVERQFQDISVYELFTGALANMMRVDAKLESILEGSFGFVALDQTQSGSRVAGASDLPVNTDDVLNTSSHIAVIMENGVALTTASNNIPYSFSLEAMANARVQKGLGSRKGFGIALGRFECKGKYEFLTGDTALVQKVINGTATSVMLAAVDVNGMGVLFDVPRAKFSGGKLTYDDVDSDLTAPLDWEGIKYTRPLDQSVYTLGVSFFEAIGA